VGSATLSFGGAMTLSTGGLSAKRRMRIVFLRLLWPSRADGVTAIALDRRTTSLLLLHRLRRGVGSRQRRQDISV
jgi:hypothetical protein